MNKKISIGTALSLMAIVAAITFILANSFSLQIYNKTVSNVKERAEIYKKLDEIDAFVRSNYNGDLNEATLINALAGGYINSLGDKYADYFVTSEFSAIKKAREGVSYGVGVVTENIGGYAHITEVVSGSPADAAGITAGESIVKVNTIDLLASGYDAAVAKLSGDIGTTVMVTIRNSGTDRDVMLEKTEFELVSVEYKAIDEVAYFKFSNFTDKTAEQFKKLLKNAESDGCRALIFDLRNLSSNYLKPCTDILTSLVSEGDFAISVKKDGTGVVLATADENECTLPMAILCNRRTGGASELFACTLRDYGKAVLIGTKTQGRGLVEEYFECLDGSAVLLTTGILRTTMSDTFNSVGLKPNYEVAITDDSKEALEMLDETTDAQIKKAIEYLQARIARL